MSEGSNRSQEKRRVLSVHFAEVEYKSSHTIVQSVIGLRGCLEIECVTCSRKLQFKID